MKRLLLVTTGLGLGGAETQVVHLARRLKDRGWAVSVVSLIPPGVLAEDLREAGVPVVSLGMRSPLSVVPAAVRLAWLIRKWKPQVVHAHMFHANLLARLVRPLAPVPVLLCTAHSMYEASSRARQPREVTWREWAHRLTDFLCDLTSQVSRAGLERYIAVRAVPPAKVRLIYNGVDTTRFRPDGAEGRRVREELGLGDAFVWLAVGRLDAPKDYPTLLRAFALVGERGQVLLIAGGGPLRDQLAELARSLGMVGRVQFLGPRLDIPALMNAADAFVLSSAWEGLPMVLLEAFGCGLPVVATDSGGPRELLDGGRLGWLVPSRDPPALAQAMRLVMELSEEERRRIGEAGREHILTRFGLDRIAGEWDAVYAELLAHAGGKPRRWAVRRSWGSS